MIYYLLQTHPVLPLGHLSRLSWQTGSSVEILRMTVDDLFVVAVASSVSDTRAKFFSPNFLRLFLGAANFQIDNQMAPEAGHDFPVVLLAREKE